MTRLHRIVPTVAAALATAALLAPVAQAHPTADATSGGTTSVSQGVVHDTPLANPVSVPAAGLNHGAGVVVPDRTQPITIASNGTNWVDVFTGATAGALVIAMCAAGIGFSRRANTAT